MQNIPQIVVNGDPRTGNIGVKLAGDNGIITTHNFSTQSALHLATLLLHQAAIHPDQKQRLLVQALQQGIDHIFPETSNGNLEKVNEWVRKTLESLALASQPPKT